MSEQNQELVNQLQRQVEELRQALNQEKQNRHHCETHLEIYTQISHILTSTSTWEDLLKKLVDAIKSGFGFYQVAIFLIDNSGQWAILQEANSDDSQASKNKGYRLAINHQSIVGRAGQTRKLCFSYPHERAESKGRSDSGFYHTSLPLNAGPHPEVAIPLVVDNELYGILHIQNKVTFRQDEVTALQSVASQIATALEKEDALQEREKSSLLYEISTALSSALDFDTIAETAVSFASRLGATSGEIHLLSDTGEVYFKSTYPERNNLDDSERQRLVRQILMEGLEAWVLETKQLALVLDTQTDDRWLSVEHEEQPITVRSAICAPITIGSNRLRGAISFVHPEPHHFDERDLALLGSLTSQAATALENTSLLNDVQQSLEETHLMIDVSRQLTATSEINDVYGALVQGIMNTGADRCVLYMCDDFDSNNMPQQAEVVFVDDATYTDHQEEIGILFGLEKYPILKQAAHEQELLVLHNVSEQSDLSEVDQEFLQKSGSHHITINPLMVRSRTIGLITIEYRKKHTFKERELALYRTLGNQATIAIENARQIQQTKTALAETQTLYRAGRVLAGTTSLQEISEEALIEFLYSLDLSQGGVTLLTPDRKFGQLVAYVQDSMPQEVDALKFPLEDNMAYQQILISGQPFVSYDAQNDPRLAGFQSFNPNEFPKSLMEAPLIIQGETIGWIGADSVKEYREFSQREIDLARAMADQIAVAIQNRRLLEQTERRAEELKAVAQVGRSVSQLMDLDEILNSTVELIRGQFGFYHVSIFLLDTARKWAVVRASTGEVGKIMVERPHRLEVGGQSIVGYATSKGEPRIALDVGDDPAHFNNPLLPNTRSEMALPLISRQQVIGALDVQSEEPNAFDTEDEEILQIMTDQLTAAIENARLFEQTQRRLAEQATLYRIGIKTSATLDLQEATKGLATETAEALNVAECMLTLLEEDTVQVISDYIQEDAPFPNSQNQSFQLSELPILEQVVNLKQEMIYQANSSDTDAVSEYLKAHNGTAMAIVPVLLRNEVIGSLEVYDDKPGRIFNQEDISLLNSIALQAANVIENSRLFQAANESQTFMKTIIDQIPDPIFIKDREHRWVVVNKAFSEGVLNQPEEKVIGHTDQDYLPEAEAKTSWEQDAQMFETGEPQEFEETISSNNGQDRILYTRKVPLALSSNSQPDYLIGIINDITEQKQRERERERLIEATQRNLERTQSLYRISHTLATNVDSQIKFEMVLGEYLELLKLKEGSLSLFNKAANKNVAQAHYINGRPVPPEFSISVDDDLIFQHLQKHPTLPLTIEEINNHDLIDKDSAYLTGQKKTKAIFFIPLTVREKVVGSIAASSRRKRRFTDSDIEVAEAIADQLVVWLENRQLLTEAQHRSNLLQTAAEVSQTASSILDVDQLIRDSVNLIRDKFDFYYVGLFMVDEAKKWAVLRAGTGEAGRIQIENNHRLEIGGKSMIGWSIQNRKARIALDVGKDAVRFVNKYLPDTHSEMALPLISQNRVIGALTVQSVEHGAFSDEDVTLLQTMADQLANAIVNARLFENVAQAQKEAEARLQETEALQKLGQNLARTLQVDEIANIFFQACTTFFNFDFIIFSLIDEKQQIVRAITGYGIPEKRLKQMSCSLDSQNIMADIVRTGKTEIITGWDERFDSDIYDREQQRRWTRIFMPVTLLNKNIGQVEAGFTREKIISDSEISLLRSFINQTAMALDNAQRYETTERVARREEIIREVSAKIRESVSVDDILQTTVRELSKALGTTTGGVRLGFPSKSPYKSSSPKKNNSQNSDE